MVSVQEIILLFTKYPLPGKSKTRLIPRLGEEGAADLQKLMTEVITIKMQTISLSKGWHFTVFHEGGNNQLMKNWLGDSLSFNRQHHGDLGEKMYGAIAAHLHACRSIILIGSDCPEINAAVIEDAFTALQTHEFVLGPAYDGGYYLVGVQGTLSNTAVKHIFTDIDWGSENVLRQTIARINEAGHNYHLVKKLHDIDTPDDLKYFNYNPDT